MNLLPYDWLNKNMDKTWAPIQSRPPGKLQERKDLHLIELIWAHSDPLKRVRIRTSLIGQLTCGYSRRSLRGRSLTFLTKRCPSILEIYKCKGQNLLMCEWIFSDFNEPVTFSLAPPSGQMLHFLPRCWWEEETISILFCPILWCVMCCSFGLAPVLHRRVEEAPFRLWRRPPCPRPSAGLLLSSQEWNGKRLLFVRRYENFSEGYSCFMLKRM